MIAEIVGVEIIVRGLSRNDISLSIAIIAIIAKITGHLQP